MYSFLKKRTGLSLVVAGFFCCTALLIALIPPGPPMGRDIPFSHLICAENGETLRITLAWDGQYRLWTPLEEIAPQAKEALLLKEDQYFFFHPGFNPSSLVRAAWSTYIQKHRQGGSTLTMQLARQLYGLNTRTIGGKLQQIAHAIWLEVRYSKHDLLEAYCNLAPMGANIQGIGAAARIYFDKPAKQLSLAEGLALAVMPQNPSGRYDFDREQQLARQRLTQTWLKQHPEDAPLLTPLLTTEVSGKKRQQLPFKAPHLCDLILQNQQKIPEQIITTTLAPALQHLLEHIVHRYVETNQDRGIVNGAVLLVEGRTMDVKALVGSADFFDQLLQGQVNGVLAKRSPGSTLKPFLYGLALDQGIIHSHTVLRDLPSSFGSYQPENFDGRFIGPISAQSALIRSRNVPAIWLASQLSHPTLYDLLREAQITGLRSEHHYGLSLVLGGGELTMAELVQLYGILANNGRLRSLRYTTEDPMAQGKPLLSPQASFIVRQMLLHNPRPATHGAPGVPEGARPHWPIAWKTGTSWGFHDAWSVGMVGNYLLAVWIGNFDGSANPAFVGREAAAPLFFQIADALELATDASQIHQRPIPPGVIKVDVCQASGELPNRWCPRTVEAWFIPGTSPIHVSSLHRPVMVDKQTGKGVCPPYDISHEQKVFAFWPSDIESLFRLAGLPRQEPPLLPERCRQQGGSTPGNPPRIISPHPHGNYTLQRSKPEQGIELAASVDGSSARLYWFADTKYLGSASRQQPVHWRPKEAGAYQLSAVDDTGRSAERSIQVTFVP